MGTIIQANCDCLKDQDFFLGFGMRDFNESEGLKLCYCETCKEFMRSRTTTCETCNGPLKILYQETMAPGTIICPRCKKELILKNKGLWD